MKRKEQRGRKNNMHFAWWCDGMLDTVLLKKINYEIYSSALNDKLWEKISLGSLFATLTAS